jgi:hypothetical protein
MNKFEGFALDIVLADYPDDMGYQEVLDYLVDEHDSDLDPKLWVIEEFEDETGEQLVQRIEDMRQTALRWFGDENGVAIKWHVTDVLWVAERIKVFLNHDEAQEVLNNVIKNHDATIGVNWDVIADAILDSVYKNSIPSRGLFPFLTSSYNKEP